MTRYANLKRNADIVALFLMHVPPQEIAERLKDRYPKITRKIVYKLTGPKQREMFVVERNGERWVISGNEINQGAKE